MTNRLTFKQRIYLRFVHPLLRGYPAQFLRNERARIEENIPKVNLQIRNIQNLKVVLNRELLIENMTKNGIVAEIGVDHGDFSEYILKTALPKKLHLIDAWADPGRYGNDLKNLVENKFKTEIENDLVNLNVGFSTEVLMHFPNEYFDWVYLDTDHSYQTTKAELEILKLKVKSDGIIAGHDYIIGNWIDSYRYGVIEAVNEFCVNENWEIIFLTSDTDQYRSFAIRKILI